MKQSVTIRLEEEDVKLAVKPVLEAFEDPEKIRKRQKVEKIIALTHETGMELLLVRYVLTRLQGALEAIEGEPGEEVSQLGEEGGENGDESRWASSMGNHSHPFCRAGAEDEEPDMGSE